MEGAPSAWWSCRSASDSWPDAVGYRFIFLAIAALLLVPLWFVDHVREPTTCRAEQTFDRRAFRVLVEPHHAAFCLVVILAWTAFRESTDWSRSPCRTSWASRLGGSGFR